MEPRSTFLQLAKHMVGAYPYEPWPEAPWLNLPQSDSQIEEAYNLYNEQEMQNEREIKSAIDDWLAGKPWPPVTDIQAYLLGIRIDSVCNFLFELCTPDNFIKCPDKPDKDILRWFLIEWWKQHGANRYFANRWECSL